MTDLEIGDDPMLCHLCGKDIAGSEIVEHLRVEHGGGVSAVSPDARNLRLVKAKLRAGTELAMGLPGARLSAVECHTLLSALDALEQAGGGSKSDSGGTGFSLSPVVEPWPYVPEPHDGEHCQECGRGYYRMIYSVPDDLWDEIAAGDNLLCPPCFDARCRQLNVQLYWEAARGMFPTERREIDALQKSVPESWRSL